MIGGVWANGNYDAQEEGKDGARREILQGIEEQFDDAIRMIQTGESPKRDDIDWEDPFFAASKAPRMRTEDAIHASREDDEAQKEKAKFIRSLDQG